jgi:hypothetical protein
MASAVPTSRWKTTPIDPAAITVVLTMKSTARRRAHDG